MVRLSFVFICYRHTGTIPHKCCLRVLHVNHFNAELNVKKGFSRSGTLSKDNHNWILHMNFVLVKNSCKT